MLLSFSILELQGASDDVPQSFLTAWSLPLVPLIGLALTLLLYLRGWRAAHRTRQRELPAWRAASFVAGIAALWIAIASPILLVGAGREQEATSARKGRPVGQLQRA